MKNFDDEDIRRVLEESDGEDSLFNVYDHEEIVEDDDVDIDEREEETVEAIAREIQHGGEMGESAHSEILSGQHENVEIPDSLITISNPTNVSSRTSRSRRIQSQVSLDSEWQVVVKDLSRKPFTGHDEPTRQNLLFDVNTDLYTIFRKIVDDDVLKLMVQQTNLYAARLLQEPAKPHSRKKRWSDVDESEMLKFLGVILLMDLCGTLNKKRRGIPKDVTNAALQVGEIAVKQKNENINVLKWKDKRDVCILSTCHGKGLSMTIARTPKLKPDMILTYNKAKKGIDIADQLSSYNTPVRKTLIWYKKVAKDLLAIAVINFMIIFNELHPKKKERYTVLASNEAIVKRLLQIEPAQ
ncbi:unnamed protein product [Parnassius apollo]|uniref:(apollo) hypothetical protein n=1 Tax=Parnassius apollo TaxID=110799 RepID=A0A8S3WGT1_PARAO|nr:unnamed protein product [Parnassius apollo]